MDSTDSNHRRNTLSKIDAPLTPELERILKAYLEIQDEEKRVEERKSSLKSELLDALAGHGDGMWLPVVDNLPLKVRIVRDTAITYNEKLLRERLGEKYKDILSPDIHKIRRHLADLEEVLQPFIGKLGKPDRTKIRKAVEKGEIPTESFTGAFKKSPRNLVAIMRRPQD